MWMNWLLCWDASLGSSQPLIWDFIWSTVSLGQCGRKIPQKTFIVEKTIHFEKEVNLNLQYVIQFAYLLHVLVYHVLKSWIETRENLEGFPLGWRGLREKLHLVKWLIVCWKKRKGGLGIRSLSVLNRALLGKWCWRYPLEEETFLKKAIMSKYGEEQLGGCSQNVRERYGLGVWKNIRKH